MAALINTFDSIAASSDSDAFSIEKSIAKAKSKKVPKDRRTTRTRQLLSLVDLLTAQPTELARHITHVDNQLFKAIQPREFFKETWKKKPDSNIKAMTDKTKEWSRFVATAILSADKKDIRIALIDKFLDTAQHLLILKNYSGFFGIMGGLQHPAIERLTKTLQGLKPQSTAIFKQLQQITSKDNHFKVYKEKQSTSLPPSVPFLDVFLEEIAYIDSFNQDIGKGGIINFSKHRKMGRIVRQLEQLKSVAYPNESPPPQSFQDLLWAQLFSDDVLQKKSLNIEEPSTFV